MYGSRREPWDAFGYQLRFRSLVFAVVELVASRKASGRTYITHMVQAGCIRLNAIQKKKNCSEECAPEGDGATCQYIRWQHRR